MNGRDEYITKEITRKGEGRTARRKREAQRWGRGSRDVRGVGDSSPRARWSPLPGPIGSSDLERFSFPPFRTSCRLIRSQLLDPFSTNSL